MINIGIVGMGFMGTTHYHAAKWLKGGRVKAIVTRDPKKKQGDWTGVGGNLGTGGGKEDLSEVSVYDSFEELLADDSVDLIDICLPSRMHRETAEQALAAGKHVLVEKPIALSLADADAMIAARTRAQRHLLVAHVLRFFPHFAYLKRLCETGEYGNLVALHLKRVISNPDWRASNRAEENGGVILDLHVHDLDFALYLCGSPDGVNASGTVNDQKNIMYAATQLLYPNVTVSAHCGALAVRSIPFEHGYDAYFDDATVSYTSHGNLLRLYTKDGQVEDPQVPDADGFASELQYAVDTVSGHVDGSSLSPETARDALRLSLAVSDSVLRGKTMGGRGT